MQFEIFHVLVSSMDEEYLEHIAREAENDRTKREQGWES